MLFQIALVIIGLGCVVIDFFLSIRPPSKSLENIDRGHSKERMDKLEKEITSLKNDSEKLRREYDTLLGEHTKERQAQSKLEQALIEKQNLCDSLQKDLDNRDQRLKEKESELQNKSSHNSELQVQINLLKKAIEFLRSGHTKMSDTIRDLKTKNQAHIEEIDAQKRTIAQLKEENSSKVALRDYEMIKHQLEATENVLKRFYGLKKLNHVRKKKANKKGRIKIATPSPEQIPSPCKEELSPVL